MEISRRAVLAGGAAAALSLPALGQGQVGRKRSLRIAHLTDIHVQPEKNAPRGMERCLEAAQGHKPDVIFTGGDLIMDALAADFDRTKAQWDIFTSVLRANTKLPVEHCIGNHDVWGWSAREKYEGQPGFGKAYALDRLELERPYRGFDRSGWHFIVLDSTSAIKGNGYTARLDPEQFRWLQEDLKKVPKGMPILVLSHIPILAACAYFDGENEKTGNWRVPGAWMHIDARRIKDALKGYNVRACLSGHIHLVDRVDYLGVSYFCNGAACGSWWNGPFQEFGPGYAIVDLYDDGAVENTFYEYRWPVGG